ncbi:beta-1,3-galactosyltransferase 1-like [Babylonia areolata]|uniref:beta-1,3-galactosyltransferase 1-like n=1 Tax=Babylonia areolata TaxID=304850 RepID=UPI003FD1DEB8
MPKLTAKRLLWLGLAVVAGATLYLISLPSHRPLTFSRTSPTSCITVQKDGVPHYTRETSSLSHQKDQTPHESRDLIAGIPKETSLDGQETETSLQGSDFTVTTASLPSELEKLEAQAARIKTVLIPPTFKYSNDIYFHPPEVGGSGLMRDLSNFIINPVDVCSVSAESGADSPFLVMLVLSSYLNDMAREREAIRATYGSVTRGRHWPKSRHLSAPVRMVFVLGTPPTDKDRRLVQAESAQYGDLLVADFVDSYRNLTLKVLHGLHWVLRYCPQAKFILKADDDVFVNVPLLTTFLLNRGSNNSIYGHIYLVPRVFRGKGRWAVDEDVYPFSYFPVYMSGTSYVMATDAARKILKTSHVVPLIPVEDAFITGVLAQITGVRRINTSGFTQFSERQPDVCDFFKGVRFVGNDMHAVEKIGLWTILKSHDLFRSCAL